MANLILELDEYPEREFVLRISPVSGKAYWDLVGLEVPWTRDGVATLAAALEPFVVAWPLDEPMAEADPNLVIALREHWARGVREVPLPLPLRRSVGTPSSEVPNQAPSPAPSSPTE